jgi:DNA-binding NarL/FixJ family response regulator
MSKLRHLAVLIDAEPQVRSTVNAALGGDASGWELRCRSYSECILEDCTRIPAPDVILLDLVAGDDGGLNRVGTLATALPGIPLLALSAASGGEPEIALFFAGASGYLPKPLSLGLVRDRFARAARGLLTFSEDAQSALLQSFQRAFNCRGFAGFTDAERRVMNWILQAKRDKEISDGLRMGLGTVHTHLTSIFSKLGVHNRREAASVYLRIICADAPPSDLRRVTISRRVL